MSTHDVLNLLNECGEKPFYCFSATSLIIQQNRSIKVRLYLSYDTKIFELVF